MYTTTTFGSEGSHPFINFLSLMFYVLTISLAPMMYFYVKRICILEKKQESSSPLIHFLPSLLLLLINVISFITLYRVEEDGELHILVRDVMTYSNFFAIIFVFFIQNVIYIYLALKLYFNHKKSVEEVYSFEDGVDLKWLLTFILGYIIIILFILAFLLIPSFYTGVLAVLIIVYLLIIYKYAQSQKELPDQVEINSEINSEIEPHSDIDSNLLITKEKLEKIMESDRPYLNEDLNIYRLSKLTDTNMKLLSKTINRAYNMNFASYINMHRIEEAKILLSDPSQDKFTLESLAQKTGFNSRSAFNRAFQKNTGMSPSKYKQTLR